MNNQYPSYNDFLKKINNNIKSIISLDEINYYKNNYLSS